MRALVLPAVLITMSLVPASAQTSRPADADLYIIYPRDGQRLRGEFPVRFGLRNMGVTYAGDTRANAGHHHLLVDVKEPIEANVPLPTSNNYLHFGGGQTETRLKLSPGYHTLQLVLGDAEHKPFNPILASRKITIRVLSPVRPGKSRAAVSRLEQQR
jgi:hypothetical protein